MRVVVTGCAGFIGSHLTERLLADGANVTGVDTFGPTYDTARRRARMSGLAGRRSFEFLEGDLTHLDLPPVLDGADAVFHLAARPGVRASWADFENVSRANILATQRVLDAMKGGGSRLVFASSSSVYGSAARFPTDEATPLNPISPYGVSKAAGESLISAYSSQHGIDAVSLRYFTVYGPRQRSDMAFTKWIRLALAGLPLPIYGDGSAIRDFTYVDDVVEATLLAASVAVEGHTVFNVAGGSPTTVSEVIETLSTVIGDRVELDHGSTAKGDPSRTTGDTTRLRDATGWLPRWSLHDGLVEQVGWLRSLDA
jgi:nucleoside-diphosphate-sugar epimerase